MFGAGLCLLLLAAGARGEGATTSISFPALPEAAVIEGRVDSVTARHRYPEGLEAVQSIANVVLKVLDSESVRVSPKNWVVSPLSLTATIAQLLLGSRGHLQTVLADSLSLDKSVKPTSRLEVHRQLGQLMRYLAEPTHERYTLELNGAVFIQPGIVLKQTYKHALLDFYNAQIFPVDFQRRPAESTQTINNWVRDSTHGKLPNLFSQPLPSSTISVMANAVYFNGRWEVPFVPEFTRPAPFYISHNKKVDVEFMFGEKELLYKNTSDMQLIGIPYKNREVVLYILLPHNTLQTSLSVNRLDEIISTAGRENITLAMPKLKLLSTISVKQSVLKYIMKSERLATRTVILSDYSSRRKENSLGGSKGFNPGNGPSHQYGRKPSTATPAGAPTTPSPNFHGGDDSIFEDGEKFDVGGASEDSQFKFDDVIHQVSLEIDEKGSEIAAATAGLVDYSGDVFLLSINRPFWFFVRHEITKTHLFWGRIVDPSKNTN